MTFPVKSDVPNYYLQVSNVRLQQVLNVGGLDNKLILAYRFLIH